MFFNRNKVMILVKKFTIILVLTVFFLSGILAKPADTLAPAFAEDKIIDLERFAGKTRYETALKIAGENWTNASGVVLARGDAFPDALAGAVLANSSGINGPLLLTDSKYLRTDILLEIKRLGASKVYILGGTGAISGQVEQSLRTNGIEPVRIDGADRFGTAAKIAAASMETSTRAFLVSGEKFADALSISSYAAAKGIPLLLTKVKKVPPETMNTLKELGVTDITLIGGTGVISPDIEEYLKQSGYNVGRLSGTDRYETNTAILKALDYNLDKMIAATGTSFPDALAGSVLAARNNNPIVLVPNDVDKIVSATTGSYMNDNRHLVNKFVLLGGSAVLSYTVESFIVSGKTNPRISLQFWDGYGSRTSYERQLQYVPDNFTDHIHILSPNFGGSLQEDGSFGYAFPDAAIPKYLVSLGQSKGAKVVPLIYDDKKLASEVLRSPEKRKNFVDSAVKMVEETNADGFLFDLELLADDTGPGLNSLMQDLYGRLNPKGKLVMISVMSKTSDTAEPWTAEYNYRELAKYADYIQIMSYDKYWDKPGPVAPLDWVRKVMAYAVTRIPEEKILMGVPYYGRAWKAVDGGYALDHMDWPEAVQTAEKYGVHITRETTSTDLVGIPTFRYEDENGNKWIVYYDDPQSWESKLALLDEFNLGGIGSWSMHWVDEVSAPVVYPMIKARMS